MMHEGRGQAHNWTDEQGFWHQHLYSADSDQCWCGYPAVTTATTVTVTAAQHGVMNPDGSWTVEEWEADP